MQKYDSMIAILLLVVSVLPILIKVDKKRMPARNLVVIAAMAALCVVGRAAFSVIPLPNFKPVSAIIIITGIAFGARAGYLTGTLAGFLTNFLYGQGPWTPWQMFCFGVIGLLAGIFQKAGFFGNIGADALGLDQKKIKSVRLCIFGFFCGIGYGWVMNLYHIIGYIHPITWHSIAATYVTGFFHDLCHGACTAMLLWIVGDVWLKKLYRIKKKFGLEDKEPKCNMTPPV